MISYGFRDFKLSLQWHLLFLYFHHLRSQPLSGIHGLELGRPQTLKNSDPVEFIGPFMVRGYLTFKMLVALAMTHLPLSISIFTKK